MFLGGWADFRLIDPAEDHLGHVILGHHTPVKPSEPAWGVFFSKRLATKSPKLYPDAVV